jgi:hypothetical protein
MVVERAALDHRRSPATWSRSPASSTGLCYKRLVIYALRLGEVLVDSRPAIIYYAAIDEHGMRTPVVAANDDAALREITAAAGGREVVCEEALQSAAQRLGLRAQALPRWTLGPRADLATVVRLGENRIEGEALAAVGPALRAAGELVCHQPWSWLRNADVVDFEIASPGRATRRFEGCVMGGGGQEYGVALYDEPGSLDRLAKASQPGRPDRARAIDAYGFTIDGGPAWVADAVAAAYGIRLVIVPIRVRSGHMRAATADDLTVMASAAAAAAHLTPAYREHAATIVIADVPTTATARVRPLRATRRRSHPTGDARPRLPGVALHQPRPADPRPTDPDLRPEVLRWRRPADLHETGPADPRDPVAAALRPPATPTLTPTLNAYCDALGIAVPSLAAVRDHAEANSYALLIVALLEHGGPMTLAQVAARFEAADIAPIDDALRSLQRCRPARSPIYRDGDRYGLDPLDAEADLWAFRLGLRPPRHAPVSAPTPPPSPRPNPDARLTVVELDEAWRDANLSNWSAQRLALAVLDAHDRGMSPDEVVAFVSARASAHRLAPDPTTFRRHNAAVAIAEDGTWAIVPGAPELGMARHAVRDAIERARRQPRRSTPEEIVASRRAADQRRAVHAAELAALRRVIVHAFPATSPRAVVLVDVASHQLVTLLDDELATAAERLLAYDVIVGVDIRAVLRALGVDPGARRLAELGPPQKSRRLDRGGRTLQITAAMLIQGSCGISRPLGDPKKLQGYLEVGQVAQLRRRLEADAKALFALHAYGRLHGAVRLRWGLLDEMFPAPWHHHDEPTLHALMREAQTHSVAIEAVIGAAPGWDEPWLRAVHLAVDQGRHAYDLFLVDPDRGAVDARDVQLARLAVTLH